VWAAFALPLGLLSASVLMQEHHRGRHARWVAWQAAARSAAIPRLRAAVAMSDPTTAARMAHRVADLVERRHGAIPAHRGPLSAQERLFLSSSHRDDVPARLLAWIAAETCTPQECQDRAILCPFYRALRARLLQEPSDVDG
jgi:hypothetical protein